MSESFEYTITTPEVRWDSLNVRYAASTIDFMRDQNQKVVSIVGDQEFNGQPLADATFKHHGFLLDLQFKGYPYAANQSGDYFSLQMLVLPTWLVKDHPVTLDESFLLTEWQREPIFGPGGPTTWPIGWDYKLVHQIVHGSVTESRHSVPEPSTVGLLLMGLIAALLLRSVERFDRRLHKHEVMA